MKVYIVYTNTDLTEGRGYQIPIYHTTNRFTAKRLARGRGVMGSDANVIEIDLLDYNGKTYIPFSCVSVAYPSDEDKSNELAYLKRQEALAKIKELGADEETLKVLGIDK